MCTCNNVSLEKLKENYSTPLFHAIHHNCMECIIKYIHNKNVRDPMSDFTPLELAVASQNYELILFLIERGAHINPEKSESMRELEWSPLSVAIDTKNYEISEYLKSCGATIPSYYSNRLLQTEE